jgi:hypothetical protein
MVNKSWSQVVFFPRAEGDIESLVEGSFDGKKVVVTKVADMDGNAIALTPKEQQDAWECLYDSMFNYTGPGEKFA